MGVWEAKHLEQIGAPPSASPAPPPPSASLGSRSNGSIDPAIACAASSDRLLTPCLLLRHADDVHLLYGARAIAVHPSASDEPLILPLIADTMCAHAAQRCRCVSPSPTVSLRAACARSHRALRAITHSVCAYPAVVRPSSSQVPIRSMSRGARRSCRRLVARYVLARLYPKCALLATPRPAARAREPPASSAAPAAVHLPPYPFERVYLPPDILSRYPFPIQIAYLDSLCLSFAPRNRRPIQIGSQTYLDTLSDDPI